MRICRGCGVKLENDLEYCPLCDIETEKIDDDFSLDYPYVRTGFSRRMFVKIVTFLAVVIAAISFLINHLLKTDSHWVPITVAVIFYIWLSLMNIARDTKNPGSITLCQLLTVSGLCFIIDYFSGWKRWSVNYVIPGLIMAAAVTIVLFILIRPVKYRAYTVYQLVIAVLGALDVLLWIAGFSEIEWPVVAAAGVSTLCFSVTMVFSSVSARSELRKRFHI